MARNSGFFGRTARLALLFAATLAPACVFNPQPEPPGETGVFGSSVDGSSGAGTDETTQNGCFGEGGAGGSGGGCAGALGGAGGV